MSTSASSARGRSWGKRRVRRGLRDWSAGAAGRRSVALACEAWRGTLERRNAAQLRPVQGLTTEHLDAVHGFWRVFACFWGRWLRTHFAAPCEPANGENGAVQPRITPSNAPSTPQQPGRKC